MDQMIDMLQSEDEDFLKKRYNYLELLRNLVPDFNTARKMTISEQTISKNQ